MIYPQSNPPKPLQVTHHVVFHKIHAILHKLSQLMAPRIRSCLCNVHIVAYKNVVELLHIHPNHLRLEPLLQPLRMELSYQLLLYASCRFYRIRKWRIHTSARHQKQSNSWQVSNWLKPSSLVRLESNSRLRYLIRCLLVLVFLRSQLLVSRDMVHLQVLTAFSRQYLDSLYDTLAYYSDF